MKKLIVQHFYYESLLGSAFFNQVNIRVDDETLTDQLFNQEKDDYYLDDLESQRLSLELAITFFQKNYIDIMKGKYKLTPENISGIRLILNLNQSQFAAYLGIHKGSMSKYLKAKIDLNRPIAISMMDKLFLELNNKGIARKLLQLDKIENTGNRHVDTVLYQTINKVA